MATSFIQAFQARENGSASWEDYIHKLFSRCTEPAHKGMMSEKEFMETYKLRNIDPLGHITFMWTGIVDPIDDIRPLEAVFKAYRSQDFDSVSSQLTALEHMPKQIYSGMRKSLAMLALQERRPDVLKLCLDLGGFPMESSFVDQGDMVDAEKDPETYQVMKQSSQLQRIWAQDEETRQRVEECRKRGFGPGMDATFDRGGKLPVDW